MIAHITALRKASVASDDRVFREICHDVLSTDTLKITRDGEAVRTERIDELIRQVCPPHGRKAWRDGGVRVAAEMAN